MKYFFISLKSKLLRINDGNIPIAFACLLFVTTDGCAGRLSAADLTVTDGTNRIFIKTLSRLLAEGEVMQSIMGIDAGDMHVTPEAKIALSKEIQRLPAAEKSRLMLLRLLAFNYDGENAEMLKEDLGTDKVRVGETLSRITDDDFRKACRNLGFPEDRVTLFRAVVEEWRSADKRSEVRPK